MSFPKVNRLTFDKHSVVLFSAFVLAGAATHISSRNNGLQLASNADTSELRTESRQEAESDVRTQVLVAPARG